MDESLKGKRALVTGAGRGIGRGTAIALHKNGAKVTALSKTKEHLATLAAEYPGIETVCVDLGDWDELEKALSGLGPIDLLVNNAAVGALENFVDVTKANIDLGFAVNVRAPMLIGSVVARGMKERGTGGSIVNISSQAAKLAFQGHAVYSATKAALDAITCNMAMELGPYNIRTNSVNPTVVLTDLGKLAWGDPAKGDPMKARIPMGRFAEIHEIVDVILFLLSDKASMVTGQHLAVDGGFLVSGLAFK